MVRLNANPDDRHDEKQKKKKKVNNKLTEGDNSEEDSPDHSTRKTKTGIQPKLDSAAAKMVTDLGRGISG